MVQSCKRFDARTPACQKGLTSCSKAVREGAAPQIGLAQECWMLLSWLPDTRLLSWSPSRLITF
jgi:hypothetical protein